MLNTLLLLAEEGQQQAPDQQGNPFGGMMLFLPAMILLFYFMFIRPAKRQEAQRKALLSSLEKDDKVLTNGGIIGWVVSVQDDEVTVRIADNVKVKMVKSGIAQNLTKTEALAAPKQPETAITTK